MSTLPSLDAIQARADAWRDAKEHSHESQHQLVVAVAAASASVADVPVLVPALRAALDLHRAVEVEPSDTICAGCSTLRGAGESLRYFPVTEWPCATVRAVTAHIDTTPKEKP